MTSCTNKKVGICSPFPNVLDFGMTCSAAMFKSGVISRGAQRGGAPFLKFLLILGAQSPQNSCIGLAFQSLLALLPKCYDQLSTAIWQLRHFLMLNILYQYFMFSSLKKWV